jgi:23S rRNA pseudouridine2605 synthase
VVVDRHLVGVRVKVDGHRVTDLGTKIDPDAHKVSVDDHPVRAEKFVYWAVHKPPGYLCTNHDPAGRPLASDLIPHVGQRVYTVGRLDEASEGLLLMTNDGELANALTHPRYGVEKTYLVLVAGRPGPDDLRKLLDGVWLSDGKVKAMAVRRMKPQGDSTWLRVVLAEGKNREIRRMLAQLGHKVLRLRRVAIGPVELDRLPKGKARKVSLRELDGLKKTAAAGQKRVEAAARRARGEAPTEPPPSARPGRPATPGWSPPGPAGSRRGPASAAHGAAGRTPPPRRRRRPGLG